MKNETTATESIKFAARAAWRAYKSGDAAALEVWARIVKSEAYLLPLFEGVSFATYARYERFIYAIAS